ncbi:MULTISPECIES: hypothetical protein [Pseudomonas]|uniref:Uncharacterized protein n=2 Tax=Pseudomonadaceae TaxID=135621 RepID=A0A0D0L0X8_9PSED|nr:MULTISPECIES: hypothetical protein [Pseudomonas]KIQ06040.1 hypothetical protein RU08_02280 [Pseudomonas fulva]MCW2293565.1 hypothetical protein [Pseudomonas sp. BIGb0408]NYH71864.1 hypothetical protein [Pseudomonas flavescens]
MSNTPIDQTPPNAPAKDVQGDDVNVVKKEIQRPGEKTEAIDRVITPTSIKTKEQEAQKIREKSQEAERKIRQQD